MSTTKTERSTRPAPAPRTAEPPRRPRSLHHDFREVVETVVSVLILVNLLRMFGAEAFVIPTGSMAVTLLGAHKSKACPQCGYTSTINASVEVEQHIPVRDGYCQNCRYHLDVAGQSPKGGDRVIVSKFLYEGFDHPDRWDVVVFKYPVETEPGDRNHTSKTNFIKRLVGLPNETIAIRFGDIYVRPKGAGASFAIARKPPPVMLAVRRLVYDNDFQPQDLEAAGFPPAWVATDAWKTGNDGKSFHTVNGKGSLDFRHLLRDAEQRNGVVPPTLVKDFESYNSTGFNWVGDLMIECKLTVDELAGRIGLVLVEGRREYLCLFDLAGRQVTLLQNGVEIARGESPIRSTGAWDVRFCNFDDRLTLWVEDRLVFGDGVAVDPLTEQECGPTDADLQPARILADQAKATVANLRLYRDIYYTQSALYADYPRGSSLKALTTGDLAEWRRSLWNTMLAPNEYAVGPDQFFVLGDNSPSSQDGREWRGTKFVARHLLLGRALVLYWPPWNWKFVR